MSPPRARRAPLLAAASAALLFAPVAAAEEAGGREDTFAACQDYADNDHDGRVDCWDQDCRIFDVCARPGALFTPSEETLAACQDGVDNDGDSLRDCDDPECLAFRACAPAQPEDSLAACQDAEDNDHDGRTDCDDPGCASFGPCLPPPAVAPPPPPPPPPSLPTTGVVRIVSPAPGATLSIDGAPRGPLPWQGELEPGVHTVRVAAAGYGDFEQPLTVVASAEPVELSAELEPLPPAQAFGLFSLGLGVQVPLLTLGEATSMSTAGASFVVRPALAVVRSPIAFEIGLQLAGGYLADAAYPEISRAGRDYSTNDALAFYDAKYFQAGLSLGLTIPLLSRDRPLLALTFGVTNGITAWPLQYFMDAALGLSWFATRMVELRFELLAVELRRIDALMTRDDREEVELKDVWVLHLAPAILVNLRF